MTKYFEKISAPKPARWNQHCLLVIQFPISLRSQVRLSARFDGVKFEVRPALERERPGRARNFFLHPAMLPFALDFRRRGSEVDSRYVAGLGHKVQLA